ncbi:MAG: ribose transport system ATP-binding protein [Rhodospirillaceae bacterium]|jgi:ribose transport system ATP-binding protein|nr:ribose transport system ATP-binding protein [Rhodospirillaceae bacterium]
MSATLPLEDASGGHPLLALATVGKRYGGVVALEDVSFAVSARSIHAVLGENGAGKSTLIKIVGGVVSPDSGRIEIDGKEAIFLAPRDAISNGVVCVFQELSLIPDLTVADNICITDAPSRFGLIDRRAQLRRSEALLATIGCEDINPRLTVKDLPLSRRQLIEIAKALGRDPRLLVLDEATSALTAADAQRVYRIVLNLRERGLAVIYISHRMHEIEELADTCTVLRGGHHIATFKSSDRRPDEILQMMIGRDLSRIYPPKPPPAAPKPPVLEVSRFSWTNRLSDVTLTVGRGEIVGLGGLDGQGQRELLLGLFGVLRETKGAIRLNGRNVALRSPADAQAAGLSLALVPEDRKSEGLMLSMSVRENMTLAALRRISRGPLIDLAEETRIATQAVRDLAITAASLESPVGSLSGGNQQKVVLAKWLMIEPRIILLNDPMRGIDVGTKQELYGVMRTLADKGVSILFYSTDHDELIGMCDKIVVLYQGRVVCELTGEAMTEANMMAASLSLPQAAAH